MFNTYSALEFNLRTKKNRDGGDGAEDDDEDVDEQDEEFGARSPELNEQQKEIHISKQDWDQIALLCEVLENPREMTTRVQSNKLTAGDFLILWEQCKQVLEKRYDEICNLDDFEEVQENSSLPLGILKGMNAREDELIGGNPMFFGAVLADPRYFYLAVRHEGFKVTKLTNFLVVKTSSVLIILFHMCFMLSF